MTKEDVNFHDVDRPHLICFGHSSVVRFPTMWSMKGCRRLLRYVSCSFDAVIIMS